jgi:hypothetical protein
MMVVGEPQYASGKPIWCASGRIFILFRLLDFFLNFLNSAGTTLFQFAEDNFYPRRTTRFVGGIFYIPGAF